jgi:hypothetical protein
MDSRSVPFVRVRLDAQRISISLSPSDRDRLDRIIKNRNAAQKHGWHAEIVLLTSDGVGTNEIMRRTGTSKTCV